MLQRCVWGGVKIPFLFEDDIYLMSPEKRTIEYYLNNTFTAPRVFNFHPIHIFLNSDSMECYENARKYFQDYQKLKCFRNTVTSGIRDYFVTLITIGKEKGYEFLKIKDGNWE